MAQGNEEIRVHSFSGTGRYGAKNFGRDRIIKKCIVVPRYGEQGEEETGTSRTVSSGLEVFLPPGHVIAAQDEVTVRGDRYEVDGKPVDLRKKSGRPMNLQVFLKMATGG